MPGPLRILFSEAYYHVARGNEEGQFFRTIQVALSFLEKLAASRQI